MSVPGPEPAVRFATGTTVKDYGWYRRWLQVAESCGFEMLTTGDSQSLWADPFVSMAVAADRTTRPRLGITVSNPMQLATPLWWPVRWWRCRRSRGVAWRRPG